MRKKMNEKKTEELSFEQSYERLEQILEKMNSKAIALDEALKLYEEAEKLIYSCNKRLNEAEQKIEILSKNRLGELTVDEKGKPQLDPFIASSHNTLSH
jgi:exodeoxyribonuclease VII small subunit